MLKKSRASIVKTYDKKVSKFVQERDKARFGKCPLCKVREITCAFHFVTRKKFRLRWNVQINIIGSCWPCNSAFSGRWGGGNQTTAWKWYLDYYGKPQFEELEHESNMPPVPMKDWEIQEQSDLFDCLGQTENLKG